MNWLRRHWQRSDFAPNAQWCWSGLKKTLLVLAVASLPVHSHSEQAPNNQNLVGHGGPVKAITIAGQFALSGSFDYSAILWKLREGQPPILERHYDDHGGAINTVAFVPDCQCFISAGDDGAIYLWSTTSGKLLHRFEGHATKVVSLAVSKSGKIAASGSWDRSVGLWDLQNFKRLATLDSNNSPVNAVLISADGETVYSGTYAGALIRHSPNSDQPDRILHRHGWGINVMKWLPGTGQILFGTLNGDVQIYDLKMDQISKVLIPHQRPVLALAVSADGQFLASGGGDGIIRVWRISDWSLVEELNSSFGPVWSMDFSQDGKNIYYAGLDDYVVSWTIRPRSFANEAQGEFPRRFQKSRNMSPGELEFARKCSICHTLKAGDKNRAGPSLHGVFGRVAGSLENYNYSQGLKNSTIIWNERTIDQLFALGPQHVTPGSKMPLQKIDQKEKRDALISFLITSTK